jgi:uncharacterized protein YbjT (DUF2867 family)
VNWLKGRQLHLALEARHVTTLNSDKLITIIGGSGFIGRQLTRTLAKRGYRVRVACRRPDLASATFPPGTPGQIAFVQANVRFPDSLVAACQGAYAVVNATGTDQSRGNQTYDAVIAFGSEAIAKAARAAGASLMIMVSGIGAGAHEVARAAQAKAETATQKNFPGAMIVRPSVVFGPDDRFFNKMASMARFSPVMPLFGGGESKFQPVFVGDVAEALAKLIDGGTNTGKVYELGGPEVASLKELTQFTLDAAQRKRLLLPVPWGIAGLIGSIAGLLPGAPIDADQIDLIKPDNIVSDTAKREGRDLAGLGITPRSFRSIAPGYLYRFRKEGQFTAPSGTPQ